MITVTVPVKNRKRPAPIEVSDFNSAISKMAAFVSKVGGEGGPLKLGDVVLRVNGKAAGVGSEMNSLLRRNFKELSSTEVVGGHSSAAFYPEWLRARGSSRGGCWGWGRGGWWRCRQLSAVA